MIYSVHICTTGIRRRDAEDDKSTTSAKGSLSGFSGQVSERPRSELIEGVELRRKPKEPDAATPQQTIAGEPELFKVSSQKVPLESER